MTNKKRGAFVAISVVLILYFAYAIIGNPMVYVNNVNLAKSLKSIESENVLLNEVIPFEWDTLYTFEPYQSKKSIEKIVGFSSPNIEVNQINEGMVHLLFVKDNHVVASILGYDSNLNYNINLSPKMKITYADNAKFTVKKSKGIIMLSLT